MNVAVTVGFDIHIHKCYASAMNLNRPHYQSCQHCNRRFKATANRQVFCSLDCRLWSEVEKHGKAECWPWIGATDKDGYGRFRWQYKMFRAHSVAFRCSFPDEELTPCVLHTCDNPPCCNPNHLFGGTNRDNVNDRNSKGRTRWNPQAGDNGRNSPRDSNGKFKQRIEGMCGV